MGKSEGRVHGFKWVNAANGRNKSIRHVLRPKTVSPVKWATVKEWARQSKDAEEEE